MSIWLINWTNSQGGPGYDDNEGYSTLPRSQAPLSDAILYHT